MKNTFGIAVKEKLVGISPCLILGAGIGARIWGYASSSIRYDEALSLYRATIPFHQFIADHQYYSSLFLWELILRLIVSGNETLYVLRLPSLLLGIGILFLSHKLMQLFGFNLFQMVITLLMIALSPSLIWVSQDARAYGLLIFLYLLAVYFVERKKIIGLIAVVGLTAYTHAIGPAFGISALFYYHVKYPKEYRKLLLIGVIVLCVWLPWYFLYFNIQPVSGFRSIFWLGPLSFTEMIMDCYRAIRLSNPGLLSFVLSLVAITGINVMLILTSIRERIKETIIFLAPVGIILLESLIWQNVFFYRTIITLLIPFMLCIGKIYSQPASTMRKAIITLFCIYLILPGILVWDPVRVNGRIEETAQAIQANWKDGDILYYGTGTAALPYDYYLNGRPSYLIDGITNANLTPPTYRKYSFKSLEEISYGRAWVIFPDDQFIPDEQMARLKRYIQGATFIDRVAIFQVPDIYIYLVQQPNH